MEAITWDIITIMKTDIYINNFVINEYILTLSKWERKAKRNEKKITSLTWELRSKFSNYYQFRWVWRRLLIKYKWSIWGRRIVCWVQWKDGGFLLWFIQIQWKRSSTFRRVLCLRDSPLFQWQWMCSRNKYQNIQYWSQWTRMCLNTNSWYKQVMYFASDLYIHDIILR